MQTVATAAASPARSLREALRCSKNAIELKSATNTKFKLKQHRPSCHSFKICNATAFTKYKLLLPPANFQLYGQTHKEDTAVKK